MAGQRNIIFRALFYISVCTNLYRLWYHGTVKPQFTAPRFTANIFTTDVSFPSNSAVNQGFTVWCNVEVGDKEKLPEREGFSISISLAWALFEVLPSFESIKSLTNQILLHWKNLRKIAWYWLAFDKKVLFERECYLKIGKSNQKNYSTQNKNLIGVELNSTAVSVTVKRVR